MEFENAGIELYNLPQAATTTLQPIEPAYRKVLWLQWLITWLVILVAALILVFFVNNLRATVWIILIGAGLVLLAVSNWFLISKSCAYKAYAIREHDIMYRTGWLIRSIRVCPFNRIQHCSMESGILERKFGLATLAVFTAGGNEADMKIPGLTEKDAIALRELIIQKTGVDADKL